MVPFCYLYATKYDVVLDKIEQSELRTHNFHKTTTKFAENSVMEREMRDERAIETEQNWEREKEREKRNFCESFRQTHAVCIYNT